jgi:hypothetical protein
MAEWLKRQTVNLLRVLLDVGSTPTFFTSKYNVVGSVPALGAGSHVFKSHYFESGFDSNFPKFIHFYPKQSILKKINHAQLRR